MIVTELIVVIIQTAWGLMMSFEIISSLHRDIGDVVHGHFQLEEWFVRSAAVRTTQFPSTVCTHIKG